MSNSGIGIAISGGGFRATLFHLGSFWRLNELGYLKKINRICSVSGGSITTGMLGYKWCKLNFNDEGTATNFNQEVADPLQKFCTKKIDAPAILGGWLSILKSPGDIITKKYDKLFNGATINDLPSDNEGPRIIIYATNLQTGVSYRFSKPYMGDYKIGLTDNPKTSLAKAVAASSAFPPVLTPIMLDGQKYVWHSHDKKWSENPNEYRKEIYLSDGGVYDNLGLEGIWKNKKIGCILVSDAGAPFGYQKKPWLLKYSQLKKMLRVLDITVNQTRALRKRQLIDEFIRGYLKGTYWGIATQINEYELPDAMVKDNKITASLQNIRTRLDPFTKKEQGQLINWGYALCDAAMRKHVKTDLPKPKELPYPDISIG